VTLDGLDIRRSITNHSKRRVTCELAWLVGTDFADIQEAQGGCRDQHATVDGAPGSGSLIFEYRHPNLHYRSTLTARGDGARMITDSRIATPIDLDRQQSRELGLCVDGSTTDGSVSDEDIREREQVLSDWRDHFARFTAPSNREIETCSRHRFGPHKRTRSANDWSARSVVSAWTA
jgi:N-terminal domain of (some) glycogen debranching enzymes